MFGILRNMVIQTAFAEIPTSLLPPDSSACTSIFTDGGFLASNTPSGVSGSTGFVCIAEFVGHLTLFVISVAASLSLMMLVVNGYRYMIGPAIPGGSSDGAKKGITAAIVGLVLSLLAYIIIDTVIRAVTL